MKHIQLLSAAVICATLALPQMAAAQTAPAIPPAITTPDKVEVTTRYARFQGRRAEQSRAGKSLRPDRLHARLHVRIWHKADIQFAVASLLAKNGSLNYEAFWSRSVALTTRTKLELDQRKEARRQFNINRKGEGA